MSVFKKRSCTFCAGMCKILTKECANVHSIKYKEYVECAEIIIQENACSCKVLSQVWRLYVNVNETLSFFLVC